MIGTCRPWALSLLRIVVGLLFLEHGTSKYLGLPVSQMTGASPTTLGGFNGLIEIIGGLLIVLGLFTRPVAFILAGDMAVAYFLAHSPVDFIRFPTAANWRSSTASPSSISPGRAGPLSIDYLLAGRARPHPA